MPPGGAADFIGRLIGAKLADALGQPVVISSRGGAGGTTAATAVAKSDPEGYTLLLNTIATHGIGPHIYANLPYDPVKFSTAAVLFRSARNKNCALGAICASEFLRIPLHRLETSHFNAPMNSRARRRSH